MQCRVFPTCTPGWPRIFFSRNSGEKETRRKWLISVAAPVLAASSSLASEVLLTGSSPVSSPASSVVELLSRMFSFDPLLDL